MQLRSLGLLAFLVAESAAIHPRRGGGNASQVQARPGERRQRLHRLRRRKRRGGKSCLDDYELWSGTQFYLQGSDPDPSFYARIFAAREINIRVVHVITPLPMDPDIEVHFNRHRDENQDYEFKTYDTPQMVRYLQEKELAKEMDAFSRLNHVVMRADLFRLVLMVHEGGVYLDDKAGLLKPLRDWLPSISNGGVLMVGSCGITNWFMAARPQHPVFVTLLDSVVNKILNGFTPAGAVKFEAKVWWLTGPLHYTTTLAKFFNEDVVPCIGHLNPSCPYDKVEWEKKSFHASHNGTNSAELTILNGKDVEKRYLQYRLVHPSHAPSRMHSYHKLAADTPMYGNAAFRSQ